MDGWLKQSIAITLRIGPFLDSTDGNTQETALTIAQADVVLSKAGGAFAQKNDATSCTYDAKGYYSCPLNTTDTGTLGLLKLAVHVTGALAVWHTFMVLAAQVWDSLFGADALQVHVNEITAGLITAATIADAAIDIATFAADVKTGTYLNAQVKGQDNIDFGALQKTSLNAATPASVQNIPATGSGLTALGDTRLANLDATVSSRLAPAGTLAACTLVNGLAANVITAASMAADAGTEIAAAVWAKTGAITSLAIELLLERLYEMVNNKMIVTESSGAVALRNLVDGADVATGNVQDLGATTVRAGLTWV